MIQSVLSWMGEASAVDRGLLFYASMALFPILQPILYHAYSYIVSCFVTTVLLDESDHLYNAVCLWLNDNAIFYGVFQSAKAVSYKNTLHNGSREQKCHEASHEQLRRRGHTFRLIPLRGWQLFRYKGKWILVRHVLIPHAGEGDYPKSITGYKRGLKLQHIGFSLAILFQLLLEACQNGQNGSVAQINVYKATQAGTCTKWAKIGTRPTRDVSTIICDEVKKRMVIQNIAEYLKPETRKWQADRGIHHRAYLFSGRPGTGKTSLACALAGLFSLDIYLLSFTEGVWTEESFLRLCDSAPARCILLMQDIDVAGISLDHDRPRKQPKSNNNKSGSAPSIYLSTLLNAIDGAASQEGRIFIMTTNASDSLDSALIRPGQVDMHVRFELPSQDDYRSLFLTIFKDIVEVAGNAKAEKKAQEDGRLNELAVRFSESLPEKQFTMAEVQGFLLRHHKHPEEASAEAAAWVAEMSNEKREA